MENKEYIDDKYLESSPFIQGAIKFFFQAVEEILSGIEAEKVLEIGCGLGFSTKYLFNILKAKDFQASELRVNLVKEAQKRNPNLKIIQESGYELKRKNNEFDLVIAFEVLEHLENPELAVRELHRVTSQYCLVSVPREPLWKILNVCRLKYLKHLGNTPDHINHWSKSEFIRFLNPYFKVKKIKTPLPWMIILAEKQALNGV